MTDWPYTQEERLRGILAKKRRRKAPVPEVAVYWDFKVTLDAEDRKEKPCPPLKETLNADSPS